MATSQGPAKSAIPVINTPKAEPGQLPDVDNQLQEADPAEEDAEDLTGGSDAPVEREIAQSAAVNKPVIPARTASKVPYVEKTVEIHAIKDHKCNIGGTEYEVKEGKSYKVPNHVAVIFSNARIAFKK